MGLAHALEEAIASKDEGGSGEKHIPLNLSLEESSNGIGLSGCDDLFAEAIGEQDVLEEGAGRDHILEKLKDGQWESLTDVARGFRGHFKVVQKAADVLIKQGKIESKQDSRLGLMLRIKK